MTNLQIVQTTYCLLNIIRDQDHICSTWVKLNLETKLNNPVYDKSGTFSAVRMCSLVGRHLKPRLNIDCPATSCWPSRVRELNARLTQISQMAFEARVVCESGQ